MAQKTTSLIPAERIERSMLLIRGEKVMLDRDLAELYGVETRALVQAVKRNLRRFPADFMFQLSKQELENWRSQFVMSNPAAKMGLRRGHDENDASEPRRAMVRGSLLMLDGKGCVTTTSTSASLATRDVAGYRR